MDLNENLEEMAKNISQQKILAENIGFDNNEEIGIENDVAFSPPLAAAIQVIDNLWNGSSEGPDSDDDSVYKYLSNEFGWSEFYKY